MLPYPTRGERIEIIYGIHWIHFQLFTAMVRLATNRFGTRIPYLEELPKS